MSIDIAQYLADSGFGTLGVDVFADQAPDSVNCVWVENAGGLPNYYVPISENVVDIYVKDTSATDAKAKITDIRNFIHRMHTTEKGDTYIYTMLVIGDIEVVQRDLEYAKIYKITVQIINRDTSLIS